MKKNMQSHKKAVKKFNSRKFAKICVHRTHTELLHSGLDSLETWRFDYDFMMSKSYTGVQVTFSSDKIVAVEIEMSFIS